MDALSVQLKALHVKKSIEEACSNMLDGKHRLQAAKDSLKAFEASNTSRDEAETAQAAEHGKAVAGLEKDVAALRRVLQELEARDQDRIGEITELTTRLEQQDSMYRKRIIVLEEDLVAAGGREDGLKQSIAAASVQGFAPDELCQCIDQRVAKVRKDARAVEGNIAQLRKEMEESKRVTATLARIVAAAQAQVDQATKALARRDSTITSLREANLALEEQLATCRGGAQLASMAEASAKSTIAGLEARLQRSQTDAAETRESHRALNASLNKALEATTSQEAHIGTLQGSVEELEDTIAALKTQLAATKPGPAPAQAPSKPPPPPAASMPALVPCPPASPIHPHPVPKDTQAPTPQAAPVQATPAAPRSPPPAATPKTPGTVPQPKPAAKKRKDDDTPAPRKSRRLNQAPRGVAAPAPAPSALSEISPNTTKSPVAAAAAGVAAPL